MYELPDLPDGYYSFWGTEPQRPDRILKDLEQSKFDENQKIVFIK